MKPSHAKSEIQSKIVKLLYEKKTMRFTELRKKIGVSKPVLSYHLGILKNENTIEFTQEGREKHYRLNEKSPNTFEKKIRDLYLSYTTYHDLITPDPTDSSKNTLRWLSSVIGCIYLFYMLKSMETGKNLTGDIRLDDFKYVILEHLLAYITESNEPFNEIDFESLDNDETLFTEVKKITSKRIYQDSLKELIDQLREEFPEPMSIIDERNKKLKI